MRQWLAVLAALTVVASAVAQAPEVVDADAQATALTGETLYAPTLPEPFRHEQQALLSEARARLEESPEALDALVWVGRRTAYLGRYREAIKIYGEGLEKHPDSPELLRHRGHRWITVRRLDAAMADLERARELVAGTEDEVEPDGLPNERGIPTSTLHTNIAYHLGLVRYLQGDFEAAGDAYRWCWGISGNPDMRAASGYWLYLTLRRLERDAEAAELLAGVADGWDVIENHDYYRLLLAYKAGAGVDDLLAQVRGDTALSTATVGYGVGAWHLVEGREERAADIFREVVAGESWAAFGHIAAEAELARAGR